jgi:acyl dehydratase
MAQTSDPRTARVGDQLPTFVRKTGLDNWNHYAAVNYEFVPIHMDDEAGRAAGYPTAFGMGALQLSYLHNLLRDWLGDHGRISRFSVQYRGPNLKGQTLTARGVVTAVRDEAGARVIDLDVWTEQQDGEKLAPGSATVVVDR